MLGSSSRWWLSGTRHEVDGRVAGRDVDHRKIDNPHEVKLEGRQSRKGHVSFLPFTVWADFCLLGIPREPPHLVDDCRFFRRILLTPMC